MTMPPARPADRFHFADHRKCTHQQATSPILPRALWLPNALSAQVPVGAGLIRLAVCFPQSVCRSIRELATLGAIMSTSRSSGQ